MYTDAALMDVLADYLASKDCAICGETDHLHSPDCIIHKLRRMPYTSEPSSIPTLVGYRPITLTPTQRSDLFIELLELQSFTPTFILVHGLLMDETNLVTVANVILWLNLAVELADTMMIQILTHVLYAVHYLPE